jgi:SAM-dependent methyltransferase
MKVDVYKKEACRLCGARELQSVFKLTPTPPGNHFVTKAELGKVQKAYPLELDFCGKCHHVQLAHVVHPDILYRTNYTYVSATSPVFVRHLQEYSAYVIDRFALPSRGLVVDIGSNDGTGLSFYKKAGYRVLGLDPATEIVQRANQSGIETLCEFFNLEVARKYEPLYGKALLINSHNACAHIDDLESVVAGARHWLADDGIFVIEVGYLLDIVQHGWFDTIYHEHVDFHTVEPLAGFLQRLGLEVISAQRISPQGGSIRLVAQKQGGPRVSDKSVDELIRLERAAGLHEAETYRAFGRKIDRLGDDLSRLVTELKKNGASIAGYGAPTKATTLLTHFRLGKVLDFLVDDNPLKQNLYSPGHHIPVYPAEELYRRKPDYLLILAWNFAENIMERHQAFRTQGGRFILPMPEPKICE